MYCYRHVRESDWRYSGWSIDLPVEISFTWKSRAAINFSSCKEDLSHNWLGRSLDLWGFSSGGLHLWPSDERDLPPLWALMPAISIGYFNQNATSLQSWLGRSGFSSICINRKDSRQKTPNFQHKSTPKHRRNQTFTSKHRWYNHLNIPVLV